MLCDLYCKRSYGYHRFSEEEFEAFYGCDVFNITDEFVDDSEEDGKTYYIAPVKNVTINLLTMKS